MLVEVRNGNIDRAIRVMKRKLTEDGMFNLLREKQAYEKPSDKRRRQKRSAIARHKRALRDQPE